MDAAQRRVTIDDLNARVARNLMLPRLDLTVQGAGCRPGRQQVAVVGPLGITSPAVSGGLGDTLGQVVCLQLPRLWRRPAVHNSFPQHRRAGATGRCPRREDARPLYRAAGRAADYSGRAAGDDIPSIWRKATIESATQARDLAQKNVEAEQQKYELGTITAFEVLDSQTRLASAESVLLNAFVGYQEAYISYQRATWTLLDGLGMVLETPPVR